MLVQAIVATACCFAHPEIVDAPRAAAIATAFLQRHPCLKAPPKGAKPTVSRLGGKWNIDFPKMRLTLEVSTGEVTSYTDFAIAERCAGFGHHAKAKIGKVFYRSTNEFDKVARSKVAGLGWSYPISRRYAKLPLPKGKVRESAVHVNFYQKPNGFSAEGCGNSLAMSLDSVTGEVVDFQRAVGYKPGSTSLNVTRAKALQIARRETPFGSKGKIYGPLYRELVRGDTLSPRGKDYLARKTLLLCYLVVGQREALTIACDTGEIVGRRSSAAADGS